MMYFITGVLFVLFFGNEILLCIKNKFNSVAIFQAYSCVVFYGSNIARLDWAARGKHKTNFIVQ